MNELTYHAFIAGETAGETMLIADEHTTIDEFASFVFTQKAMWFFDGEKYRAVIAFEDMPDAIRIYFFDDEGAIVSYSFGGDG